MATMPPINLQSTVDLRLGEILNGVRDKFRQRVAELEDQHVMAMVPLELALQTMVNQAKTKDDLIEQLKSMLENEVTKNRELKTQLVELTETYNELAGFQAVEVTDGDPPPEVVLDPAFMEHPRKVRDNPQA